MDDQGSASGARWDRLSSRTLLLRLVFPFLAAAALSPPPTLAAKFTPTQSKCSSCRFFVKTFHEGESKTAGQKWTGGDAHWEAEKLGKYETSETRLVEIMETVCKKAKGKTDKDYGVDGLQDNSDHKCHQFVEEYEEDIENWYFHKQKSNPDFTKWLCIEKIKVCCPAGRFGDECGECPMVGEAVCAGHGTCDGDGTRAGTGKCRCMAGYQGALCRKCAFNYIHTHQNETSITCQKCDDSCKGGCKEVGPIGCNECKDGYVRVETKGCEDVNECEEAEPCEEEPHSTCSNSPGSYSCDCIEGYKKQDGKCIVDIEAAMKRVEEEADKDMASKLEEEEKANASENPNDTTGSPPEDSDKAEL